MTVGQLQMLRSGPATGADGPGALPRPRTEEAGGSGFGDTLKQAVQSVDASQKEADQQIQAFVAGEQENVHEVMISMNQARLHFQLMTEVRNKALDTYQELMRMQV